MVLDGGATGSEDEGYYISPVIVADVDNSSQTAQEEIFGPVLAVVKAHDFDHAVELANDTRFGLTAGIATRSLRYAYEFIARSRLASRTSTPTAGLEFQVPFGGNKESGVGGREQGPAALDFYSSWKTVAMPQGRGRVTLPTRPGSRRPRPPSSRAPRPGMVERSPLLRIPCVADGTSTNRRMDGGQEPGEVGRGVRATSCS